MLAQKSSWNGAERAELQAILAELELRKTRAAGFDEEWLKSTGPGYVWDRPHQKLITREIREILAGRNDSLMLSMPPRHGKSELVTVRVPAYVLEKDPSKRVIVGAYSQFLANKFSRKTRKLVRARGIVPLSRDRTAMEEWETVQDGGYRAAGVNVGVTGTGGDLIIIDDPVKSRKEANSETYREAVWDWYKDDLFTRREPGAAMIVIMTRWHEDDLAGRLLEEEGTQEEGGIWKVINLPARAEKNDPLGRKIGEALWPERYNEEQLARIEKVLKHSFPALFQGRPVPAEGNMILREWFHYYRHAPSHYFEIVQSWDTAYKPDQINDPSVCTTWMIAPQGFLLLDVFRDWLPFPALKEAAISQAKMVKDRWGVNPAAVLVEDKASGQSLIQELRNSTSVPVIAIEPEGDKIFRAESTTPLYEAGLVFHLLGSPWLAKYEAELTSFPLAANDDQVDSTSQFLTWAAKRRGKFEAYGTGKRLMHSEEVQGSRDLASALAIISGNKRYRGF